MEEIETGSYLSATDSRAPGHEIRVVSWNINRGEQLDGVLEFLGRTPADLILLQETDLNARRTQYRNVAREIAQALRMDYVFGFEFEELTQGNRDSPAYHGQATLSRLPISESRILRFRRQSGFWRPRWYIPMIPGFQRRLGARMALVSHISWLETQLIVYNVHLESRGDDALRCSQLVEIIQDAQRYDSAVPIIVAGDFNFDLSQQPAASLLADSPLDSPFQSGSVRPTTTRSRLGSARTIDWILTRGPLTSLGAELDDSVLASDHYPMSLTLAPKPGSGWLLRASVFQQDCR
jgi:endonuclease/exonuclease/phosphatase family metal-dependent hydrolase